MGFHTTHWTVVLAASAEDATKKRDALARLCETYWYPLYAFIRRQGANPDDAKDLTQEFFCRFLERNALATVRPDAGKFRSFLLACLKNFLTNQREHAKAQRRGGSSEIIPLDTNEAETRYSLEPIDQSTPEAAFERRWAFALLEHTMAELRKEHLALGKADQFDDLQGFLPNGRTDLSRAELAAKRGVSVGAIDVAIHRLRQRFGVLLRQEVARTVAADEEIESELRYLISTVAH